MRGRAERRASRMRSPLVTLSAAKGAIPSMGPFASLRVTLSLGEGGGLFHRLHMCDELIDADLGALLPT